MVEYSWMDEARFYLGLAEIPGVRHNATIQSWLLRLGAWWRDDETPWCGVFVAHCLRYSGHDVPPLWMRARAWAAWGRPIGGPVYGCVVVFERAGGGHVGFVAGIDPRGRLMVLGGNQGNRVSIAPFDPARVLAYRWPAGLPVPDKRALPVIKSAGPVSEDEK